MKTTFKPWLASGLAAALVLVAGCSNNSDDVNNTGTNPNPAVAGTVPDSAGASAASFITFLMALSSSDETSEPLQIKDSFAVPPDESEGGQSLS